MENTVGYPLSWGSSAAPTDFFTSFSPLAIRSIISDKVPGEGMVSADLLAAKPPRIY